MYGKSADDLEREEQVEMKRLMQGKPGTQQEEDAEHDAAVRAEDNTDYADNLHRYASLAIRTRAPCFLVPFTYFRPLKALLMEN